MKDVFRSLGLAAQVGLTVVGSIIICLFLGMWIDARLGTTPWATLILTIVGVLVGSLSTFRAASSIVQQAAPKEEQQRAQAAIRKSALNSLGLAARLGLVLSAPVLVSFLVGQWIDNTLHSHPWATLLLAALGVIAGSAGAYRLGSTLVEQLQSIEPQGEQGEKEDS
jgi:F0F1-type ATP synthase assembly protein I